MTFGVWPNPMDIFLKSMAMAPIAINPARGLINGPPFIIDLCTSRFRLGDEKTVGMAVDFMNKGKNEL